MSVLGFKLKCRAKLPLQFLDLYHDSACLYLLWLCH